MNPLLPNPQQQQPRKRSALEETMINFIKMTQGNFEEIKKSQEAERKNNERKMLETQIGQMAKQIVEQNKGGFSGNTKENPKNETCNVIELRSKLGKSIILRLFKPSILWLIVMLIRT